MLPLAWLVAKEGVEPYSLLYQSNAEPISVYEIIYSLLKKSFKKYHPVFEATKVNQYLISIIYIYRYVFYKLCSINIDGSFWII
jgi:hypothetical protein